MSIRGFLLQKGFKPKYLGFDYIECGLEIIQEDKRCARNISTMLYPRISEKMGVNKFNIDRNIRNCLNGSGIKMTCAQMFAVLDIEYSMIRGE